MRIIGITGPTGSGKSMICRYFQESGIPCIDADSVYHRLLLPPSDCLNAIRMSFGNEIFSADGQLDRAKLAAIVFSDPQKLDILNKTVLGKVLCEIRNIIADYRRKGFDTVAVDAPTLIESGFNKECSSVICVLAPKEQRTSRIIERDCLSDEKAAQRVNAQKSDSFYIENSDFTIMNDGDVEKLKKCTLDVINQIRSGK